jgi:hypothetical protein
MTNFIGRSLVANQAEQNVELNMAFINLIVNDSTAVVTLSFDVASASAASNLMVLKAGESRQNLAVPFSKLYYKAAADTSAIRIEGLSKAEF